MAVTGSSSSDSEGKVWALCRIPFFGNNSALNNSSSANSSQSLTRNRDPLGSDLSQMSQGAANGSAQNGNSGSGARSVSSVAKSLLPTRRRLRLDPAAKLYFPWPSTKAQWPISPRAARIGGWHPPYKAMLAPPYPHETKCVGRVKYPFTLGDIPINSAHFKGQDEPGKQVRSAVRIKNTSKSHVAFKFQTTAPKSCFMRPPGGILSPGESIIATVFKFVEQPENNEKPQDQKSKVKFKIMSLKVKGPMEYVPELFDEQKDKVAVEQFLQVVFLDVEHPSPKLDKLKRQLAEAEAALEARKKPPEDTGPRIVGEGLVIDEWKERRERYLARQQVEVVDSV